MATIRHRPVRSLRSRQGLIRFARDETSQNGEDGIIAKLFELLPSKKNQLRKWCVDVGAWDGKHLSNTYSLLQTRDWNGVLIEADIERYQDLQALYPTQTCLNISVSCQPNSPRSLTNILAQTPLPHGLLDFLCIDVDGVDYWLLYDVLTCPRYIPQVICVEFNPTMPHSLIYIPPRSDEERHGCSLAALVELCEQHEYVLVETTLYNAFFVPTTIYKAHLQELVPDTSMEVLHETTMTTHLYQLYNGTLKLHGCKKLLWHGQAMDEERLQLLSKSERNFPFAPLVALEDDVTFWNEVAVDLSAYQQQQEGEFIHPTARHDASHALLNQLRHSGFGWIRGTGMSAETCRNALYYTHQFLHEAPEELRRATRSRLDRARRGYSPPGTENFGSLIGQEQPNDVVHKFRVGSETGESSLHAPNVWPPDDQQWEHATGFQDAMTAYYQQSCRVANMVVQAITDALSETQVVFPQNDNDNAPGTSILTLLGYRVGARHKRGQPLVAAHTDVGVITLLLFDAGDCATLQRCHEKDWVDVTLPTMVPENVVFVVNVGDCLSELSNGLLPSTLHRVMPSKMGQTPRNCLALFVGLEPNEELHFPNNTVMTYENWRRERIARAQRVLKGVEAQS
jgi:isopenicillin N synthase-like dioxygenase